MTATISPPAIAGPPRRAALRMLAVMSADRLGMMTDAARRYGDASRLPVGHKTLYFFNHPEYVKHVLADNGANYRKGIGLVHARRALGDGLLTSEGQLWHEQRKVIQPAFRARRVAAQAGVIAEEADRLVARLRAAPADRPVEMTDALTGLTLGVLGRALLNADLSRFPGIGGSFAAIQDQAMFELATLSAVPTWVPLSKQRRFRRARAHLQSVVDRLVDEHDDGGDPENDVLSRLVASAAAEADPRVGRVRIRDELVTLLLAGHETTASTLSWTLHLLDEHPGVWERVHTEASAVLGGAGPVTADTVHGLRYTTMVVEEAMRLFPPVWLLPRAAIGSDVVGGHPVPAGADVLVCPYTLHRHPAFWDAPERFAPERFDPGRPAGRPRYAYVPFGAGQRFCVGNSLGMMEAVLVTAILARDLRLRKVPGRPVVAEPMLSLRVRGGLSMTVRDA